MSFDVNLQAPACAACGSDVRSVFDFNITHNVNEIVDRAIKAYEYTHGPVIGRVAGHAYQTRSWGRFESWRAADAVPVLERVLATLKDPDRRVEFAALEPPNKWGSLDGTISTTQRFLDACRENPNATITTSG